MCCLRCIFRFAGEGLDKEAAIANHNACLATLICGTIVPPARLHTLKTCVHPGYNGPCLDEDCTRKDVCKGNRIEMEGEGAEAVLTYVAPHHKNEGKGKAEPITYQIPSGQLSDGLQAHFLEGQGVITIEDPHPFLFTTESGKPLNDCTLPILWKKLVTEVGGIAHFPPNKARTIYVEHYMQHHGGEQRQSHCFGKMNGKSNMCDA